MLSSPFIGATIRLRGSRSRTEASTTSDSALRKLIQEIVDNQLANGDPPEARATFARLLSEGHSEAHARKLIGFVVASEVVAVVQQGRSFDETGYVQALRALPGLPEDRRE